MSAGRISRLAERLGAEGLAAAFFEDAEGNRDQTIRYLTGHPGDALLLIMADGRSALVAWDLNLAKLLAHAGEIHAYSEFERHPLRAISGLLAGMDAPTGAKVELPSTFAYPRYIDFVEGLPDYDLVCRDGGMGAFALAQRAVKDSSEIEVYRKAAAITNALIDEIEAGVRSGRIATELDAALLIERFGREAGCEGPGFETLAAGPSRSWGIHAFPAYGAGPLGSEGLSILDFGLKLDGYTTDVTMSFVRGTLNGRKGNMIALVERAHSEAIAMLAPGKPCREVARRVDEIFAEAGFTMPHSLGHGVGLDAHEAPFIRSREDCVDVLAPGNVVTIEPGLYDPELGGVRLEDDILITQSGHEVLTKSRIVRL